MSVRVLRGGLLTTIQDLGRRGWRQHGVAVGGAMDPLALRTANMLVGNAEDATALEITLLGPTLQLEKETLLAICGGDLSPHVGERKVLLDRPALLPAGTLLEFGAARQGCRAYLAVAGGFDVPPVLGSRSTYLAAKLGGWHGRAVAVGDCLPTGCTSPRGQAIANSLRSQACRWRAGLSVGTRSPETVLRVVRGSDFQRLTPASQRALLTEAFLVTPESNRMGYRLSGPQLSLHDNRELLSTAVCPCAIQLPPQGQPILLMADCATTGGYPQLAHVVTADISLAGQLQPGDSFILREISLDTAHNLYWEQEAAIRWFKMALKLKFDG